MNLVIIESPYAAANGRSVEDNLDYARRAMRHSLDHGEAPMASHLLYTQPGVLDDSVPSERERGIQAGYEWMSVATKVAFYIDHGWSPGMMRALRAARILKRFLEVRHLGGDTTRVPLEVHDLHSAGLVEEIPSPLAGVRAFRFIPGGPDGE